MTAHLQRDIVLAGVEEEIPGVSGASEKISI
jgi:hypothetical protein